MDAVIFFDVFMKIQSLIGKLAEEKTLQHGEWVELWSNYTAADRIYAGKIARKITDEIFGRKVFLRGIVEFSNLCGNDCFYCGIRKSNTLVKRYNMSDEAILNCCSNGYKNGIRTFVLQSGEAANFDLERITALVRRIKKEFADCAVTLSLGELSFAEYAALREAGADRYLLRHETANAEHYRRMHPPSMSLQKRIECLKNLHKLNFQTGCGIMLGSPFQTAQSLADDMIFMSGFKPEMIGVGPFIPHCDTPFKAFPAGSLEDTLFMLSLCRIMLPQVLLPATTALGTLQADGRIQGILAGANVIMPNLTPEDVQQNYNLYNNKLHTDQGIARAVELLRQDLAAVNCTIAVDRGDYAGDKSSC